MNYPGDVIRKALGTGGQRVSVSVYSDLCNKMPQTGRLIKDRSLFLIVWRPSPGSRCHFCDKRNHGYFLERVLFLVHSGHLLAVLTR